MLSSCLSRLGMAKRRLTVSLLAEELIQALIPMLHIIKVARPPMAWQHNLEIVLSQLSHTLQLLLNAIPIVPPAQPGAQGITPLVSG